MLFAHDEGASETAATLKEDRWRAHCPILREEDFCASFFLPRCGVVAVVGLGHRVVVLNTTPHHTHDTRRRYVNQGNMQVETQLALCLGVEK